MDKTGRTHTHAGRVLQRNHERYFVGLYDLDRIYFPVDGSLDHSGYYPPTDPTCTVEGYVIDPGTCEQPLAAFVKFQFDERFSDSGKRHAADEGRIVSARECD